MSTFEAVHYLWEAKWEIAPWALAAVFIAVCASPDYMLRPQRERLRFLKGVFTITASLLLLACFMGLVSLVSDHSFWDGALGIGRSRRGASFFFGLIGLAVCVVFFFAELAARERSRKQEQMKSNFSSSRREEA